MNGKSLIRAKKQSGKAAKNRYQIALEAQRDLLNNAPQPSEQNLKSIWETSNMDQFLEIADMREAGYTAERNVRIVVGGSVQVLNKDNKMMPSHGLDSADRDWYALSSTLPIPKRPQWSYDMAPEKLHALEKVAYLDWRRTLNAAVESNRVIVTPFEKNLDVWRQLWRVVERSDVVLEIVDARNPMAFRCHDLEQYVSTFKNGAGASKKTILLLNKSDLLTEQQRKVWAEFLTTRGDLFYFFSALPKEPVEPPREKAESESTASVEGEGTEVSDGDEAIQGMMRERRAPNRRHTNKRRLRGAPVIHANPYEMMAMREANKQARNAPKPKQQPAPLTATERARDMRVAAMARQDELQPYDIVQPEDLLDLLAALRPRMGIMDDNTPLMVGMVGYPNVGKSSTINAIIGCKKVVVSATPGKTKHFQTFQVPNERRIQLCDCPGLVFPSFAATRESMICDGVLPIDTARDYVPPIAVVCERIPRVILEVLFKVSLRKEDDVDECTSLADRLLSQVARRRGYMTEHDKPNRSRAARDILKMYVDGKLVYVHPPRGHVPEMPTVLAQALQEKAAQAALAAQRAEAGKQRQEEWTKTREVSAKKGLTEATLRGNDRDSYNPKEPTPNAQDNAVDDDEEYVDIDDDEYEDAESDDDKRHSDEGAWEDLRQAGEARALSDVDDFDYIDDVEEEQDITRMPMFYSRPAGTGLSRQEIFNFESNAVIAIPLLQAAAAAKALKQTSRGRKGRNNPIVEVDERVVVKPDGTEEFMIDSDDEIEQIELVGEAAREHYERQAAKEHVSKRRLRRQAKKEGTMLPRGNRVKGIMGYEKS